MNTESPLKEARQAAGMTAYRLAELSGTLEARIYQWERRRFRPHDDEARRLAVVLNVTVRKLFPNGTQEDPR